MNPLEPNSMIQSRYLIVQMISEGPTGDMYLAVDQRVGSAVALKKVAEGGSNEMAALFESDAMVLTRLNHPVLPKVKDYFIDNEGYFLVVEHISGDDLAKRMERSQKPFPLSWTLFWADQLLDALTYLHSHVPAIVHGTVRPYNLKLSDDNHIILLDCGMSTAFRTPGSPVDDVSADISSLSATLYQLLTSLGVPEAGVVPLSQRNGEVPLAISEVIMKGMAGDAGGRFASASEMQKELRSAAKGGTVVPGAQTEVMSRPVITESYPPQTGGMSAAATPTEVLPRQSELKTEVFTTPDTSQQAKTEVLPSAAVTDQVAQTPMAPSEAPSQVTRLVQPKKASSSKALVISGVCVGLFIFAAVAAGGGWFVYNNYYAAEPAATPVPVLEAAATPSPEPVAVADIESNMNSSEDETPLEDVYGAAADSNKAEALKDAPRVTATPRPVAKPATKAVPPRQKPQPKPAEKPQPKRDDRTIILQ